MHHYQGQKGGMRNQEAPKGWIPNKAGNDASGREHGTTEGTEKTHHGGHGEHGDEFLPQRAERKQSKSEFKQKCLFLILES
jgi:hypothetical protein